MAQKNFLYRRRILRQLYFFRTLSCADLSVQIDRSLALTTRILNELIEEDWVIETGFAPSSGGRRPVMYSLRPDVLYTVSVAMDQLITRIVVMDMHNQPVTGIHKFEIPLAQNPAASSTLAEKINQVVSKAGIEKSRIAGIGIGMPGFIDVSKGINHTFLDVTGNSITEFLEEKTGLPVYIDNDSSLTALAELRFGAARQKKNVMVVNISWGVGLGMILNGELFRGHNGFAGEFSHIPLFTNDKLCSCGKHGCLETETSLLMVTEKAQRGLQSGVVSTLKDLTSKHYEEACEAIMQAAAKGDRYAVGLLSEAGYNIGRGVAILIHLLNPELIILSGRGSTAGKIWQAPIQQALNEHCIPRLALNAGIEVSQLGYHAELIGAASLVMENYEKDQLTNSSNTNHLKHLTHDFAQTLLSKQKV